MVIRRAFYVWQFPAAVLLPAWLLIGWTLFGGLGWEILGIVLGCVILTLAMLAISGIIFARKEVRSARAVSWLDVGVLAVWHAAVISLGFFTPATTTLVIVTLLITIAAFWVSVVELVMETRRRVRTVFEAFDVPQPSPSNRQQPNLPPVRVDGEYIVIETSRAPRI